MFPQINQRINNRQSSQAWTWQQDDSETNNNAATSLTQINLNIGRKYCKLQNRTNCYFGSVCLWI